MNRTRTIIALAAVLLFLPAFAHADTAVGSYNVDNCAPFCTVSGTVYQQVYSSTAFGGVTDFNQISFQAANAGLMPSATYTVYFSTTSAAVNNLSWASPNNNIGPDETLFGAFTLGGSAPSVLTLTGNTFDYNPASGNLLMTVLTSNVTSSVYTSFFEADSSGSATQRAFFLLGSYATGDSYGLVTDFSNVNVTSVPEPSSLLFLVSGLGLLLGLTIASKHGRISSFPGHANRFSMGSSPTQA
jgi:hypothetical protein